MWQCLRKVRLSNRCCTSRPPSVALLSPAPARREEGGSAVRGFHRAAPSTGYRLGRFRLLLRKAGKLRVPEGESVFALRPIDVEVVGRLDLALCVV